eukprot:scaffold167978_cov17-Tisochrysis_lutea.AAC.3
MGTDKVACLGTPRLMPWHGREDGGERRQAHNFFLLLSMTGTDENAYICMGALAAGGGGMAVDWVPSDMDQPLQT